MKNNDKRNPVDLGLLILRAGFGVLFIFHGYPKLAGGPETWARYGEAMNNFGISFYPEFWGFMAGAVEFFGGIFLILGIFHKTVSLLLLFVMIVAILKKISGDASYPGLAHPLKAAVVFIALLFTGPGRYKLSKKTSKPV